ncbi:glycoside hydrolase family 57 protein [Marinobacter sp. C2H3]|uniref:glycoside hydrolase family 57 protein n=1 Tax=Marinobacter sp. C2H3 TaxID=3119003 RepID=UPI00300EAD29
MASERAGGPSPKVPVVLCWHMHQPMYQDQQNGAFLQPWVYLHALKDYSDMAAYLEAHPQVHAVVNVTPVLLEQLDSYRIQIERWRLQHERPGDPVLAALVARALPEPGSLAFSALLEQTLRAHPERIIARFPDYARLAGLAQHYRDHTDLQPYVRRSLLADLLVWHHLGWMGESVRDADPRVQCLQAKGRGYTLADRLIVLDVIADVISGILPRYRALADSGQVELATSPYSHPILPLMLAFESAREAWPESALPEQPDYPGGAERVDWQLAEAIAVFEQHFGRRPAGCWPSEGGLSQATLGHLARAGFQWCASGDSVGQHSLALARRRDAPGVPDDLNRPFQFGDSPITVFFRDDGLSDRIGFQYAHWRGDDAATDLVHRLAVLARPEHGPAPQVLALILDGENAWEYYPENGRHFLGGPKGLYAALTDHPDLETTTFSALLERPGLTTARLPVLVAGSWIYGTFSTWMGDPDKNRAWDLLCAAKHRVDLTLAQHRLDDDQQRQVARHLAICEGSDWFWWFGGGNPAATVAGFETLFRRHLIHLYQLLNEPPPDALFTPLSRGDGHPVAGGTMKRGHADTGGEA